MRASKSGRKNEVQKTTKIAKNEGYKIKGKNKDFLKMVKKGSKRGGSEKREKSI